MSTFDIFLALPLAYGVFQGFRKGLLQEVVSVFALFLGFILGLKLLTTALPVVQKFVGNALGLLPFLSFLVVFVLVILGAVAVWTGAYAGAVGPAIQWAGYAALALGWALMLAAIFLRTRYHRRRMREMD